MVCFPSQQFPVGKNDYTKNDQVLRINSRDIVWLNVGEKASTIKIFSTSNYSTIAAPGNKSLRTQTTTISLSCGASRIKQPTKPFSWKDQRPIYLLFPDEILPTIRRRQRQCFLITGNDYPGVRISREECTVLYAREDCARPNLLKVRRISTTTTSRSVFVFTFHSRWSSIVFRKKLASMNIPIFPEQFRPRMPSQTSSTPGRRQHKDKQKGGQGQCRDPS